MIVFADDRMIQADPEMQLALGLILGVNHYISTGDCLGHGVWWKEHDSLCLSIAVNQTMPEDMTNFDRFQARLSELKGLGLWRMRFHRRAMPFEVWVLEVEWRDLKSFIGALFREPGPLGWGSTKTAIDQVRNGSAGAA